MPNKIVFGTAKSHILFTMYRNRLFFEDGFSASDMEQTVRDAFMNVMDYPKDQVTFPQALKELLTAGIIAASPHFPDGDLSDPKYRYYVTPNSFEIEGGLYHRLMEVIKTVFENSKNGLFTLREVLEAFDFDEETSYPEKANTVSPFLSMLVDQGYLTNEKEKFITKFHPTLFDNFSIEAVVYNFTATKKFMTYFKNLK